ncbi:MAG: cytochrome c [Thiotrichaceae bacterium]|nr:cytochrome c [Thiotrichaceae bacterium]
MPSTFFSRRYFKALSIGLLIGVLTACSRDDNHEHPDLTSGKDFFNHHCESCHGVDGTGKLVSSTPANILTQRGHDAIVNYITMDVNPQREMSVFSAMPHTEAAAVARYLLALQKQYHALPLDKKKPQALMIEP